MNHESRITNIDDSFIDISYWSLRGVAEKRALATLVIGYSVSGGNF